MTYISSFFKFIETGDLGEVKVSVGGVCGRLTVFSYKEPLVITFSNAVETVSTEAWQSNKDRIWGYNYMKSKNLNVLSFSCLDQANWYRDHRFHDFILKLAIYIQKFPVRLGYGGSMGGYAVSAFSNCLNLDRIFILNPISSLNKAIAPFENRFLKGQNFDWSTRFIDGAESNCTGFIVYDPLYNLDAMHAKRYVNLKRYCLAGVGHQMPIHLNNLKMLKLCFDYFYTGKDFDSFFYKMSKKRRNYEKYYKWMLSDANKHLTPVRKSVIKKHYRSYLAKKDNNLIVSRSDIAKLKTQAIYLYNAGSYKSSFEILSVLKSIMPDGKEIKDYYNLASKRLES
ncbi:hypothetical protein [Cobetia marina]|uniref:hypothetical protein n=1 Tax=Cobetia marina TaxID=28258 RepID=UPI00254743C0|nr:hypothetical protein [Cobetia pacifica]MDI6004289.1 hypothetical protein [Cobetia pacifica]